MTVTVTLTPSLSTRTINFSSIYVWCRGFQKNNQNEKEKQTELWKANLHLFPFSAWKCFSTEVVTLQTQHPWIIVQRCTSFLDVWFNITHIILVTCVLYHTLVLQLFTNWTRFCRVMEGAGVLSASWLNYGSLICQIWITGLLWLVEWPLECKVQKLTKCWTMSHFVISELNNSLYYFLLVGTEQNLVSSGVFTVAELYTYARSKCADVLQCHFVHH